MTDKIEHVPGELSQAEKRETLENDRRVAREQGATLAGFAQAEANIDHGRYGAQEKTVVVTGGAPVYPHGPGWSTADQSLEPALGIDVNAQQPTGEVFEVERSIQQLGGADVAPTGHDVVETAAPPTSTEEKSRED